jgi:hypothetical protein
LWIGESVMTIADASPTRNVPGGFGVIVKVRYDKLVGRAEITVKLTIEGLRRESMSATRAHSSIGVSPVRWRALKPKR